MEYKYIDTRNDEKNGVIHTVDYNYTRGKPVGTFVI